MRICNPALNDLNLPVIHNSDLIRSSPEFLLPVHHKSHNVFRFFHNNSQVRSI